MVIGASGDEKDLSETSLQCEAEPPVLECYNLHDGVMDDAIGNGVATAEVTTKVEEIDDSMNASEDRDTNQKQLLDVARSLATRIERVEHARLPEVPRERQSGLNPEAPEFVCKGKSGLNPEAPEFIYQRADDFGALEEALAAAGALSLDACKGDVASAFGNLGMYGDFTLSSADSCGVLLHPDDWNACSKYYTPCQKSWVADSLVDMIQSVRKQELFAARCIQKAWRRYLSCPRTRPSVPRPKRDVKMRGKSFKDAALTVPSSQDSSWTNAWANYSWTVDAVPKLSKSDKRSKSLDSKRIGFSSVGAPSTRSRIALLGQIHEGVVSRIDAGRGFTWIESIEVRRLAGDNVRVDNRSSDVESFQIGDEVLFRVELSPDSRPRARKVWRATCNEPLDFDPGEYRPAVEAEMHQEGGKLQAQSSELGDDGGEMARHTANVADPWAAAAVEKTSSDHPLTREALLSEVHEGRVADYFKRKGHGFIKHRRIFDLLGKDVFYLGSDFPSARRENVAISFRVIMDRDGRPRAYPPKAVMRSRSLAPVRDFVSESSPWAAYTGKCSTQLGAVNRCHPSSSRSASKGRLLIAPADDLKALLDSEHDGIVTEYDADKGYGFVKNDRVRKVCGSDVHFSREQLHDCKVGWAVKFRMELDDFGKPCVKDGLRGNSDHPSCSSVTKPSRLHVASEKCDDESLMTLEECLSSVHEGVVADYDSVKARGFVRNPRVYRLFGKDVLFHKGQFEDCTVGNIVHFGVELDLDGRPRVRDLSELRDLRAKEENTKEHLTHEGLLSTCHEGVIYQFAKDKGYGFIRNLAIQRLCGRDVFITAQHFAGREVGDSVKFNVELTSDGLPRAKNVLGIGEEPTALTIETLLTREHKGSIVDWDESQGVGFIKNRQIHDLCGKDVLFRSGEFPGKTIGDIVCFSVAMDEKGRPRTRDIAGEKIVHDGGKIFDGTKAGSVKAGRARSHSASFRSHSIGRKANVASENVDLESMPYVSKLLASDAIVALIIGRRASTISELSRSTGARFTFTARDDCYVGTNFRVMTAFAPSERSLREALQQIVDTIADQEIEKQMRSNSSAEDDVQLQMRPLVPIFVVPHLIGEDAAGLQQLSDATGVKVALDSEVVGVGPGQERTLTLTGGGAQLRASFAWLIRRFGNASGDECFRQWALRTNTPADPHFVKSLPQHQASTAPGEFNVVLGSEFGPLGLQFRSDDPWVVESCQHELEEFWEERQRLCVGDRLVKVNGRSIQGRAQDASLELERRPVLLTFARSCSLAGAKTCPTKPTKREGLSHAAADSTTSWNNSSWWNGYYSRSWTWNDWYKGDTWNDWHTNKWQRNYWDCKSSDDYAVIDAWEQRSEEPVHELADKDSRRIADTDS